MKKILLSKRSLVIATGVSIVGMLALNGLNYQLASKESKLYSAQNGVGVCFQRVIQTYTALMIGDLSSSFLDKSFKETTGECFSEVSSSLSETLGASPVLLNTLSNLKSDIHWFNKKVSKLARLSGEDANFTQSNINKKFQSLEELREKLDSAISGEIIKGGNIKSLGMAGIILSQLAFLLAMGVMFVQRKKSLSQLATIEKAAGQSTHSCDEQFVQRSLKKINESTQMPNTFDAIQKHVSELSLDNAKLQDILIQVNTVGTKLSVDDLVELQTSIRPEDTEQRNLADFSLAMNTILDRVQDKVQAHGIFLDTDLNDEFSIFSNQEDIEQLLFNTIQYAMDSVAHSQSEKRITLRSKPLGGIAYCKIRVAGHSFTDAEINYMNGITNAKSDTISVNLVLLRELLGDANTMVAVKNHQSEGKIESEIELIFDRSPVSAKEANASSKVTKSVIRGTKTEIKRMLEKSV